MIPIGGKKPDWAKIRAEYIGGGTSYRKLAKKHGVSFRTLSSRAISEGWAADRERARNSGVTKAVQRTASEIAANAAKFERARGLMLDHLIAALEQMPKNGGSHSRQMITDGGKRLTVDHDLLAMMTILEKLSNGQAMETAFDPMNENGW